MKEPFVTDVSKSEPPDAMLQSAVFPDTKSNVSAAVPAAITLKRIVASVCALELVNVLPPVGT